MSRSVPQWKKAYRLINSCFPPISVFEDTLDPQDLEIAFAIEGLTNDRLLEEGGKLARVPRDDRVSGPGSTAVMAAFTHIGKQSRFTDGSYGVYYCADSLHTAIAETRFHQERFFAATGEQSLEITMRAYVNKVIEPMLDVRERADLHGPDVSNYEVPQAFARIQREAGEWGLLYKSVRASGGECVAAFRPKAVSRPVQGAHLRYIWDGKAQSITAVVELNELTL
ncbi:RES family NAD+ phosphorylase [Pseudomonas matsuisoli]|uniref:RES domain-containing protein n=1 Tax=Pseudomonas matsuisoli TaxID=1515666 RepID=A0A917UUK8_9PSED|nr:RES family NAD+ phosphorylase [Pseudomonas matsuisoli]GGJ86176.1 hypothetical protein GCM10009304_10320 [Pseudomonas matsuisoli]